jgi:hypothetical protein
LLVINFQKFRELVITELCSPYEKLTL